MRLAVLALIAALAAPASAAGPKACRTQDLTLASGGSQGAAGTAFEQLRLVPRRGVRCVMRGYPGVRLLGAHGRTLPIRVGRIHDDLHPVRTLTFSHRHPARFDLRHPSFDPKTTRPCALRVYAIRVIPPNQTGSLALRLRQPRPRFCTRGARVTPVGRRY